MSILTTMPLFFFFFFFFFFVLLSTSTPLCPPSHSHFPFSVTRGLGHPSFQINCSSSNTSLLLLSSHSFPLLSSTSHSLTLSLPFLPHSPINLSSTPFHLSPSSCPSFSHFFLNQCHHHHPNSSSLNLPAPFQLLWNPQTDPYFVRCYNSCRRRVCGYDDSLLSKPFRCLAGHHNWNRSLFICVFLLLLVLASSVVVLVWALTFFRREVNPPVTEDYSMLAFLRCHRLPNFTYDELSTATAGFDSKRKIGDGGFGSVFLAYFDGGRVAAVKRLHRRHPDLAGKSFCNEILILSSLRHPNLVRLHGYCCDPRGLLLVYDYVPNGTLSEHLHSGSAELPWNVRVDVALQIAMALEYLHFTVKPPVVHRDVTTSNVFVDKEMRVKVGDFGLSRLLCLPEGGTECVWTGPQGTPGYLDPDYHRSFRLTEKSDVYSFGVVLLELITGMRAVDTTRDKREVGLADMVVSKIQIGELQKVVDPVLVRRGEGMGMVDAVAELAFRCLADNKDDRPDARELVVELRRIKNRTQDASGC